MDVCSFHCTIQAEKYGGKFQSFFGSSAGSMMKDEREGRLPSRLAHGRTPISSIEEAPNIIEPAEETFFGQRVIHSKNSETKKDTDCA
jgi:hypothetical protein